MIKKLMEGKEGIEDVHKELQSKYNEIQQEKFDAVQARHQLESDLK